GAVYRRRSARLQLPREAGLPLQARRYAADDVHEVEHVVEIHRAILVVVASARWARRDARHDVYEDEHVQEVTGSVLVQVSDADLLREAGAREVDQVGPSRRPEAPQSDGAAGAGAVRGMLRGERGVQEDRQARGVERVLVVRRDREVV